MKSELELHLDKTRKAQAEKRKAHAEANKDAIARSRAWHAELGVIDAKVAEYRSALIAEAQLRHNASKVTP